jgi:hypothetical protein
MRSREASVGSGTAPGTPASWQPRARQGFAAPLRVLDPPPAVGTLRRDTQREAVKGPEGAKRTP